MTLVIVISPKSLAFLLEIRMAMSHGMGWEKAQVGGGLIRELYMTSAEKIWRVSCCLLWGRVPTSINISVLTFLTL